MGDSAKPIELNEVGPYGALAARPNPSGFAILQVPPFESLLPFLARRYGRELTAEEVETERNKAPSMVVTQVDAAQMAVARSKRGSAA